MKFALTERELHRAVGTLLRLCGIEYVESRMDKRTTQRRGVPDILFAVPQGAVAWELKLPGKKLDPEQQAMFVRMTTRPNGWQCRVIHSVDEALAELRRLGLLDNSPEQSETAQAGVTGRHLKPGPAPVPLRKQAQLP